jgi:aminoglycoside phosphotransferase
VQPLAHGYTNDTRGDGTTVSKRYQGPHATAARDSEHLALTRLAGRLPIPALLDVAPDALLMAHVDGVHGQELMDAGYAEPVLWSCGETLRLLQAIDPATVFPDAPAGSVIVHGDYGPNNALFDPVTFAVTAVLDWEWTRPGDPIDDLAWCEWIVRMHHPDAVDALDHLFAGYGSRPPWPERRAAALATCHALLPAGEDGPGVEQWRHRIEVTRTWRE